MAGQTPWNRRWKAVLAALVVADVVIVASAAAWQYAWRLRSMHEILEMPSWQAGTTVDVEGVVTGVDRWNTTYGPVVMLSLDGAQGCWMVFGNPATDYVAGERFRTTLHFQEYRINGERAVMAPELVCPLPTMYISLAVLSEASMLQSRGVGLAFSLYEPDGWATYEVITRNRDAYPLDIFPLALWKRAPRGNATNPLVIDTVDEWRDEWDLDYWRLNANYSRASTEVDSIASLADPASWTDRIRYEDTNGNGLLDDGDRIAIHLDPTGENAYDTYILDLAAFPGFPQSERQYGGLYILNGPRGPYSIPGVSSGGVQLRFVADRLNGSVNSTLEVAGMGTPTSPPYVSCTFTLYTGGPGSDDGTLAETPVVLQGNRTMDYDDRNGNGLLDRGDRFVIGGLRNQSSASLGLRCGGGYGNIEWYPGHGYVALPFPPMDFTSSTGRPPYRITARVAYLHPELALNHTVIVTLREDTWSYPPTQAVVDGVPLVNGTLGTWPNGTLSFVDADGDAFLSTGDYFNRQGIRTSDYLLEISFRFGGPWHYVDIPGDII